MNPKQLGCVVLVVLMLVVVQLALMMQRRAKATSAEADAAQQQVAQLQTQLSAERATLGDLQDQSKDLIDFVSEWAPFFAVLEQKQEAETNISMKVRSANMLNLSQRYQQVQHKINNKENASLPVLVRASLVFDDSYSKLLNWLGEMERTKPTMRVGKLVLSKGSRGEDLRMEVTLEVPLKKK